MSELNMRFITDNLHNLRKSEVKVALYVVDNAQKVIHTSVSELSDAVGVSEPTVIRFTRGLGFKGFQDFKIQLAQSVVPTSRAIHESVNKGEAVPELVAKVFQTNVEAINSTLHTLSFKVVQEAVERLSTAGKIVFIGFGGSAVVAMDAYHKFFRIGIPCEWFNDGHLGIMAASMLREGDVLVAISHSGESRDIIDAVEVANATGAISLGLISHQSSPVSKVCTHALCVAAEETHYRFEPMSARIAQLCVVDVLAVGVSLQRADTYVSNLQKSRKALTKKRY